MQSPNWDPHQRLLTYAEAAHSVERPPSTIRRWVAEGRLKIVDVFASDRGLRPLLLEADVLRVDAETRRRKHAP